MISSRTLLMSAIFFTAFAALPRAAHSEIRGVIELFTSQGCNSCPPADKVLGDLAKDPSIIAISMSVDIWDYLGWKDTLASPEHTKRQRAYAYARADRDVFTPQAIVNGSMSVIGSNKAAIERAIEDSRRRSPILSLPVSATIANGVLKINTAEGKAVRSGEVWLCPISHAVPVAISRGENSGKTIVYHNIVRRRIKLADWKGGAESWSVPLKDIQANGTDAIAVLVQAGNSQMPGPMLGAALAQIR